MQSRKKVLVVDDDEMHLYTTKELLQNEHIEVGTHKNWFGATNRLREFRPDLVLLDVNMPGLSGDMLAEIMKPYCETKEIPIVFHSSNDEESLRELAATHGAAGYISKGDVIGLRNKIKHYLKMPD